MGTKYSNEFKERALVFLNLIRQNKTVSIDNDQVINVRSLCAKLGISSYSLYEWEKQIILTNEMIEKYQEDQEEKEVATQRKTPKSHKDRWDVIEGDALVIKSEIRWWGTIASVLGVKGYSSMSPTQLQLVIGIALIKRSKLVDVDKIVKCFELAMGDK